MTGSDTWTYDIADMRYLQGMIAHQILVVQNLTQGIC